jgi:hypothetical protein
LERGKITSAGPFFSYQGFLFFCRTGPEVHSALPVSSVCPLAPRLRLDTLHRNRRLRMDYNQVLAQYQQNQQTIFFTGLAIWIFMLVVSCFVIYLFYARLRGIEDELRKFRIAYEFGQDRQMRSVPRQEHSSHSAWPEPPDSLSPSPEDSRYIPKV